MLFFLMNNSKLLFFSLMIFSILLVLSSNSWISCWMGLEINSMAFIPFIFKKNNSMSAEMSIKYFIVQAISSINFLFLILMINFNLWNLNFFYNLILININLSLMLKLGSSPFHFWMINIIESLSWMNLFIFFTLQKLPPLIMISYYLNFKFLNFMIILNCLFGSLGGLNQTSIRKILTYSSIYNFSWMFSALLISDNMFLFFMLMYSMILISLMMYFNMFKLTYMNQLFLMKKNKFMLLIISLNFLSLGGLPPLLGFVTKWMISIYLINMNMYIIMILMMSSLINLYYYIQLIYPIIILNKFEIKWINLINEKLTLNYKIWSWLFFSTMNMILITLIMNLF